MIWNDHSKDIPKGAHAFLSPSNHSWLNYDNAKLITTYRNRMASVLGTRLHALAAEHIDLGIKMPRSKTTLNLYINDAIGFGLKTEQPIKYSRHCFGTADAIAFDEKKGFLRIHDLKTGITPASLEQLEIYAALFCLEYGPILGFKPTDIGYELRIYQNDDILIGNPNGDYIKPIMTWIKVASDILDKEDQENGLY